jgi:hypothetical protein
MLRISLFMLGFAASLGSAQASNNAAPGTPASERFAVRVVSSAPDQVTGGDARVHVTVPHTVPLHQVRITVNSADQRDRFALIPGTRTLTGVVSGLVVGDNALHVAANGNGRGRPDPVHATLVNFPLTGPVFSGPHQYPFVCNTVAQGLGQPIADDTQTGTRVVDANGQQVGLSRNCSVPRQVRFLYRSTGNSWKDYTPGMVRPVDMAQTTTIDGRTVDFVVRQERGTINRFMYSIAALAPDDTGPWQAGRSAWNGKAVFRFEGGVAIGRTQGSYNGAALDPMPLGRGYAVLFSTGNRTSTHYNLIVGGETALMVKERFVELYDVPKYTVAIGGSGGAIQQYVYAQNHPGLLDGGIPQYSYPDMVTQTVHVGDCELLEFYMDVLDAANPKWKTWSNRTILQGMAASDTVLNPYTGNRPGNTECINGWRGLSPLALNPLFGQAPNQANFVPQSAVLPGGSTEWTHFADIVNVVGKGADGYARRYWDNVGVQYGLRAVASGQISGAEFLRLNGAIGGWKQPGAMVQEGQPFVPVGGFDPWSSRNQVFSTNPAAPAQRYLGNVEAMNAVYRSGLVFRGDIDIPIIDWRHYLEDELDMHNSHQSFASRKRMLNVDGDASNQVVWFTDVVNPAQRFDQTPEALEVLDEWLENIRANPSGGVAGNKPPRATDRCFDDKGQQIAAGSNVWDGVIDGKAAGACTQKFKLYSTSRRVAGGPFEQSLFKCQLMPVSTAIARGDYGAWQPNAAEVAALNAVFPGGVCDYTRPDAGLPLGW